MKHYLDGKPAAPPSEHLTPAFEAAWAAHDTSPFHSRKAHYAEVFAWRDGEIARLRAAMEDATYQLSKARIWGGMEWTYNPLHPIHYKPALDRLREVLDTPKD
jgi:hypothetical protein